jgi:sugar phosphate isomerase/epimerase
MDRLAVCAWSLQSRSPAHLIEQMKRIGLDKVQLGLDEPRALPQWNHVGRELAEAGIRIVGGMMRCEGEDYSTMQAIARTGGVVPDATWPTTWGNMRRMAPIARSLGVDYVMFHAGFLPHDGNDPAYAKLLGRLGQVADLFGELEIRVGFETGQEDAPTLIAMLNLLNKPNVGVNFDPANIILYDVGDPIEALRLLGPRVLQVHIKDAIRTTVKGEWGQEVRAGTGQVDWKRFKQTLDASGFAGYLAIEREAGDDREGDIAAAVKLLESL